MQAIGLNAKIYFEQAQSGCHVAEELWSELVMLTSGIRTRTTQDGGGGGGGVQGGGQLAAYL